MPRFPALALELTGMSALPEVLYGRNSGHRTDDALGSVRLVVDATGGVEGAFDHDVWGVPDTSVTPPGAELRAHTFVGGLGQRNEGDGLYYARQGRNMSRVLRQFLLEFSVVVLCCGGRSWSVSPKPPGQVNVGDGVDNLRQLLDGLGQRFSLC